MDIANWLRSKKFGALKFCANYRNLNALTIRDAYPINRMDKCIDYLGEDNVFRTLVANYGYWKIEIDDRDKQKRHLRRTTDCTVSSEFSLV